MLLGQLFSQRVGYAVHALCYLASTPPRQGMTTVRRCRSGCGRSGRVFGNIPGERHSAPRACGLLMSQRGFGGYCLPGSEEITLCDVVTLLEGVSYARCSVTPSGKCSLQAKCTNYESLCRLQRSYADCSPESAWPTWPRHGGPGAERTTRQALAK